MLVATGTALVLLTWAVCAVALVSAGLVPALAAGPATGSAGGVPVLRRAMWWGLLLVALFAYLANLAWPLAGHQTALAGVLALALLGVPGWLWWRHGRAKARARQAPRSVVAAFEPGRGRLRRTGSVLLWAALGAAVVYLAVAALGPVTNYDSGLYHLGAIRYAADFPTIPGLANLYFALAYGNAEFPLAALLGNGPWGVEGYRLLNGLVVALAVLDLAMRWPGGPRLRVGSIVIGRGSAVRRTTPGFYVLLVGLLAALVPLVALSDYWVTSPTQDSFVFVITVVATAYLADATAGGRRWLADGATALALGILLVLLRPTMVAFAGTALIVVLALAWRRRAALSAHRPGWVLLTVATAGVVAASAAAARDYLLSGWLQFPLSVHAFDVPWLADDPAGSRLATLGYHRNPADMWGSVEGWAWLGPWLTNRLTQWETYQLAGLVVVAFVLAHLADRATRPHARWRAMLLAMAPSLVATLVWFVATPPSYRFAWGQLFTLGTIPIGWALWLLSTRTHGGRISPPTWRALTAVAVAVPVLLVTAYSAVARLDLDAIATEREWTLGISIPYAVAPVVDVPVVEVQTTGGLTLLQPTQSDQCWWNYPLCTPQPNPGLRLRGDDIASGFLR